MGRFSRLEAPPQGDLFTSQGDVENAFYMLRRFLWAVRPLRDASPLKPRTLGIGELHGKPIDPSSLISPWLSVLAMSWSWSLSFCQKVLVHVGGLSGIQEYAALRDKRAAIPRTTAHFALGPASGSTRTKFSFKPTESPRLHGPRGCPYTLLTRQVRKMNFGASLLTGVSVKNRRIWMIKLAIEEALRRNTLSGRPCVDSWNTFLTRLCYGVHASRFFQACTPSLMRTLARSPSLWSGVRRELRGAASLLPFVFADLRRPWYNIRCVGDASMSGYGVCECQCSEHTTSVIGRLSERWALGRRRTDPGS